MCTKFYSNQKTLSFTGVLTSHGMILTSKRKAVIRELKGPRSTGMHFALKSKGAAGSCGVCVVFGLNKS